MLSKTIFTPLHEALEELARRKNNSKLRAQVEEYLKGDIPQYLQSRPVFYLPRHVATPNFETLRFVELCQPHDLSIVIGTDPKDIFVSNNSLKRALGKMSIVKGMNHNLDEIIENFTIINFTASQGKSFKDIKTTFDVDLIDFHTDLFKMVYKEGVKLVDDSEWIDRNHRGDLVAHCKKMLALFLVHGIMFEYYEPEDYAYVKYVLDPAFAYIKENFGYKPLICNLVPAEIENDRDWNSYPSVFYQLVKNNLTFNSHKLKD